MLKLTYKGRFLTLKKAYEKFLDRKSKWCAYALVPPLHMEAVFLKKTKISIFDGISKFLELIVSGQILAILGSFTQVWADFAALALTDSMLEHHMKS
jgi:hypothetical protein